VSENEVDLNALFEGEVDAAKAEKDAKELLDEAGFYVSEPEMTVQVVADENDGRIKINLSGKANHGKTGNGAFIRAYLSPEVRYKENGKTPDFRYGRWLEAIKAYKDTFGEAPTKQGQVVEFLQKHPCGFVLRRTDDGTMVVKVQAVKQ